MSSKRWTAKVFVNSNVGEIPVEVYASTFRGAEQQIYAKHGNVQQIKNLRENSGGGGSFTANGIFSSGGSSDTSGYIALGVFVLCLWLIVEFWWIVIPVAVLGGIGWFLKD